MIFDEAQRPKIMILSGWESVFFWIFSIAAILAGLLTVMARNAVHSALFLISSLVSVAALFILLGAEFIAGVQILVYVGGVMVLFIFVILLVAGLLYAINSGYQGLQKRDEEAVSLAAERRATVQSQQSASATGTSTI